MRLRLVLLPAVLALALGALAPGAHAQKNCPGGGSPPGNSEVDQYSENVPGPCGDNPIGSPGDGDGNPDALPPGTADDLSALGPDGDAAATLAQATAPGGNGGGGSAGDPQGANDGANPAGAVSAQGDSLFDEIFDALTGSADGEGDDGMGLILPLILVAALVAALIYGLRRRLAD